MCTTNVLRYVLLEWCLCIFVGIIQHFANVNNIYDSCSLSSQTPKVTQDIAYTTKPPANQYDGQRVQI